jgi:hypothetical protein
MSLNSPAALVDLTLRFEKLGSEYRVQGDDEGAITSVAAQDVRPLLSNIDTNRLTGEGTPQDVDSSSRQLLDLFFQHETLARFTSARKEALSTGRTVSLRLDFEGAAELNDLPWELLANPGTGDLSLVRSIPNPSRSPEPSPTLPLRILIVGASPTDLPPFDLDLQWEILRKALQDDIEAGRVSLERLKEASEAGLQNALAEGQFQVLHFVGYGRSKPLASYGSLFEDQNRRSRAMPAEYLAGLLRQHSALRLMVLDVGSNAAGFNPFAETANILVRTGLDAVIAMRRRLSGPAAVAFHQALYSSLASGVTIGQSVVNARRILAQCSPDPEWDAPMLYASLEARTLVPRDNSSKEPPAARELQPVDTPTVPPSSNEEPSTPNPSEGLLPPKHEERRDPPKPSRPRIRKILILAASPESLAHLRLAEEIREILASLRQAKYGRRFQVVQCPAARTRDLQQAMLEAQPQIVHFCGHGAGAEGLVLEDDDSLPRQVPSSALADLFRIFSPTVECVVLNSCYSEYQAKPISEYINFVIGMKKEIQDSAAINFASGFYGALGAGYSIDFAYQLGRNAIEIENLPGYLVPVLLERADLAAPPLAGGLRSPL